MPAQVAGALGLPSWWASALWLHLSPRKGRLLLMLRERRRWRFSVALPAVLGFQYHPERKLPYIRHEDLNRDVSSRITVLGNNELGMDESELGLKGSLTQVRRLEADALEAKDPVLLVWTRTVSTRCTTGWNRRDFYSHEAGAGVYRRRCGGGLH